MGKKQCTIVTVLLEAPEEWRKCSHKNAFSLFPEVFVGNKTASFPIA